MISPVFADADRLECVVPCRLVNEKNVRDGHWGGRTRRARVQREAVALAVYHALGGRWRIAADPARAKAVTLIAHVHNRFDSHDGLRAALSHVVDGLVDARLIQDDADRHGHVFRYDQVIDRQWRGVTISVSLLDSTRGG